MRRQRRCRARPRDELRDAISRLVSRTSTTGATQLPRKRKALRLGRLRKTVSRVNTIYGLLLQAHEALRGDVMELETRVIELERRQGFKWSHRDSAYHVGNPAALL